MAKKKAIAVEIPETAVTADGLDAINIQIANDEEIYGQVGEVTFYWFKNGKRNTGFDCPKDLIF